MADEKDASIRLQAVSTVEQTFMRQRGDLERVQTDEARAHKQTRLNEMKSFEQNRDTAIARHRGQMQGIDSREQKAAAEMQRQQGGIRGRLAGLFQPGRNEREGEALTAKFDTERMQKHRELAGLQERQGQIEQAARLRYGQEERRMGERFKDERRELSEWQAERREPMVQQQTQAIAEAQLRQGIRHEQEKTQEQTSGQEQGRSR